MRSCIESGFCIFHVVIVYGTCRHSLLSAEQKQIMCLRLWYKNIDLAFLGYRLCGRCLALLSNSNRWKFERM